MDLTGLIETSEHESSLKVLPIPSKKAFLKSLVVNMQDLIYSVIQHVIFCLQLENRQQSISQAIKTQSKSIFKTVNSPPTSNFQYEFEENVQNLTNNIQFNNYPCRYNTCLRKLHSKIKELRNAGWIYKMREFTK